MIVVADERRAHAHRLRHQRVVVLPQRDERVDRAEHAPFDALLHLLAREPRRQFTHLHTVAAPVDLAHESQGRARSRAVSERYDRQMTVEIRRMTPADAARLSAFDEDIFDGPLDPARLAFYLSAPGHLMVCAFSNGVAVGQARGVLTHQPDGASSLYVDNLGVAPSRRREGVAGQLLDELVAWGRENGCESAWVATELVNDGARALYAGRGAECATVAYYAYDL